MILIFRYAKKKENVYTTMRQCIGVKNLMLSGEEEGVRLSLI